MLYDFDFVELKMRYTFCLIDFGLHSKVPFRAPLMTWHGHSVCALYETKISLKYWS